MSQFSDWPCHMNQTLTAIIRLDELELRTTHTHTQHNSKLQFNQYFYETTMDTIHII